jgi:hypothetical protein
MLNKLVDLLRGGGSERVGDIARRLDTTPEMVEAMLQTLTQMGYLRELGDTCGDACDACPVSGMCSAESSGRIWSLTDKGMAAGR